jgi:spore coat polysaccharide biosynthesis protein SpsF
VTVSEPKVAAIIQARMGSHRLPGKVLLPLAGRPVIDHVLDRVMSVPLFDSVVVATTELPADDELCQHLAERGIKAVRGSSENVLERFVTAAREEKCDIIVRLCADSPLLDPAVMIRILRSYLENASQSDLVCNTQRPTYPEGQSVEVFSAAALLDISKRDTTEFQREHVTPYFYDHPEEFRIKNISHTTDLSAHRWTLDTTEDFEFLDRLLQLLSPADMPSIDEVVAVIEQNPELASINKGVARTARYADL